MVDYIFKRKSSGKWYRRWQDAEGGKLMTKSLGVTNKELATKTWLKLKEEGQSAATGFGSPAKTKTARQQPLSEFLTTYLYEKEKEWKISLIRWEST